MSIATPLFTTANGMQQQIVISVELLDKNSESQEKTLIYGTHWCCEIIQGSQAALEAISRYQASGYFCPKQRVLQPVRSSLQRLHVASLEDITEGKQESRLDQLVYIVVLMGTYVTYMHISPIITFHRCSVYRTF